MWNKNILHSQVVIPLERQKIYTFSNRKEQRMQTPWVLLDKINRTIKKKIKIKN